MLKTQDELTAGERLLTPEQVAEYLGVSLKTLGAIRRAGRIAYVRVSPHVIRFNRQDVDAFIDQETRERAEP